MQLACLIKGIKYLFKGLVYSIEIFIIFPPVLILAITSLLFSTFLKKKKA